MHQLYRIVILFIFMSSVSVSYGLIDGIYCGKENCYDVLGVTRDDEKATIMRAYRKLARVYHPDRQRTEEAKEEAQVQFRKIAGAYEILRDEEQRKEYDYMLDNPEAMYYHYYNYFRHRYGPKVDVRIVLAVIITTVSIFQYYGQWSNYNEAVTYLVKDPKYRNQAKQIAKEEGLLEMKKRENGRKVKKDEMRERENMIIKQIIIEKMDIRGGYSKPSFWNVLWLQMLTFPYYLLKYIWWWIRWIVVFWIIKRPYGEEEKHYIIRKNMGLKELQYENLSDKERQNFIDKELWIKEKYQAYAAEQAAEMKKKLAEDPRYKRYQRYMRKGGPGQMVFGPEDADFEF